MRDIRIYDFAMSYESISNLYSQNCNVCDISMILDNDICTTPSLATP